MHEKGQIIKAQIIAQLQLSSGEIDICFLWKNYDANVDVGY